MPRPWPVEHLAGASRADDHDRPEKLIDAGPVCHDDGWFETENWRQRLGARSFVGSGCDRQRHQSDHGSVDLGLPGIAAVSVTATSGEHPQSASWMMVGAEGVSVHTVQTRVLLSIKLIGSGAVPTVNLRLYVEVASGIATLDGVSCGCPDVTTSSVTLGVTPGIVDA